MQELFIHALIIYPFMYRMFLMDKETSHLLKEVRLWTEWSEPRIARALGVSQPTVHRILNGQSECRGSTLLAITELHARMAQREAARLQALSSLALAAAATGAMPGARMEAAAGAASVGVSVRSGAEAAGAAKA